MVKKLLALLFTSVLAFPLATTVFAQDTMAKPAKQARWEGTIIRSSQDKSTLTVRLATDALDRLKLPCQSLRR